jgi:predicted metal-binding protein
VSRRTASILVCRGCCCGSRTKHPGVNHEADLRRICEAALAGGVRVRVTGCLGVCSASNLAVVRSQEGPARWIGGLHQRHVLRALLRWIADGLDPHATPHPLERNTVSTGRQQQVTAAVLMASTGPDVDLPTPISVELKGV